MNILAIESASSVCGSALFIDNKMKMIKEVEQSRIHAEKLPVIVDEIKREANLNWKELDGIAVSAGPGSFTGLRIGMALAKGLAFSIQKPIIPVPTLLGLNYQVKTTAEYWICLYSHRDLVFAQLFVAGKSKAEPVCVSYNNLNKLPRYGFHLDKISKDFEFNKVTPSAEYIGRLAIEKFNEWVQNDINTVKPFYLTEFEINMSKKRQ